MISHDSNNHVSRVLFAFFLLSAGCTQVSPGPDVLYPATVRLTGAQAKDAIYDHIVKGGVDWGETRSQFAKRLGRPDKRKLRERGIYEFRLGAECYAIHVTGWVYWISSTRHHMERIPHEFLENDDGVYLKNEELRASLESHGYTVLTVRESIQIAMDYLSLRIPEFEKWRFEEQEVLMGVSPMRTAEIEVSLGAGYYPAGESKKASAGIVITMHPQTGFVHGYAASFRQ